MSRRGTAVFARYLALQVPGMFAAGLALVMLVRWTDLTPKLAGLLFALWVIKDLLMFPVTRIAYETQGGGRHGSEALVGQIGVAQEALAPDATGYVRVGAELWRARAEEGAPIPKGAEVLVTGARGLTLSVQRAPASKT